MIALHGRRLDAAVAVAAMAVGAASVIVGQPPGRPVVTWVLVEVSAAALGLLRRVPLVALLIEVVLVVVTDVVLPGSSHVAPLAAAVALGAVAYRHGVAVTAEAWAATFVAVLVSVGRDEGGLLSGTDGFVRILALVLAASAPVVFGRYLAALRQGAIIAEERVRDAEERRLVETRAARMTERARIAGDLHDLVAHHVSAIALRAGTGRYAATHGPDQLAEAVGALDSIHTSARQALDELRSLLHLLRDPDQPDPVVDPERMIADAIDRSRAAGLEVTLTHDPRVADAPLAVRVTAARVMQEALTNALKHAGPGAEVAATVAADDARLRIEVRNTTGAPAALPASGHGLAGMRERVEILGGTLAAGPSGTGWQVYVTLPLTVRP